MHSTLTRWLAVLLLLAAPAVALAAEPAALLKTIKAVGKEGDGNAEAGRAWKELVGLGLPALLPTLAAMDDEQPRASNWLRAAVDAIASKVEPGEFPARELEQFVRDRKNAPGGRRAAYEWLVKADATAADRVLPAMLDDPSAEMRRDAVAQVMAEAARSKDKEQARTLWNKALGASRDHDQVAAIAKGLKGLGVEVDTARHFGFITTWHTVTPFDNTAGVGFKEAYGPEAAIDLKASYKGKQNAEARWQTHTTTHPLGIVDFNKVYREEKGIVGYAYAEVEIPAQRRVEVRIGTNNAMKLWVNGREVLVRHEYHHGTSMDQYAVRVVLDKGKNTLLMKVCQNEERFDWTKTWGFQLRLSDEIGGAVPYSVVSPAVEKKTDSKGGTQ